MAHTQGQGIDLLLNLQHRHYHYDALGQLTHIQQPRQMQYYNYDPHGRLIAARLGDDDAQRHDWWYDAAGNPLPPPHAPQPVAQDWAATVRQRLHEPGFNLLQPEQQPDTAKAHCWPDNRVHFSEHEHYRYDARGNRTHSHNSQTGEIRHYHYNSLNQLVRLDHYSADHRLTCSSYRYDPLGRRLGKLVEFFQIEPATGESGQSQSQQVKRLENHPAHTEYYGWDGDRLVFCSDPADQWHYLYEPESFTPMLLIRLDSDPELDECQHIIQHNMGLFKDALSMMDADDAEEARTQMRTQLINTLKQQGLWQEPKLPKDYYFYHCNHLGLPDALTDKTGQVVWAAEYDPWGNLTTEHNPHNLKQAIRLPGQYHDTETGLYYNRHRYYDPKLGCYINQDPIGLNSGEPNFYAYPKNPVQGMDPLGLENSTTETWNTQLEQSRQEGWGVRTGGVKACIGCASGKVSVGKNNLPGGGTQNSTAKSVGTDVYSASAGTPCTMEEIPISPFSWSWWSKKLGGDNAAVTGRAVGVSVDPACVDPGKALKRAADEMTDKTANTKMGRDAKTLGTKSGDYLKSIGL